ncbi:hypothetical protein [Natrinema sp. DC36]|uniref:hypothetical protein n=1 Tax=Natrinema sp. DC36 TaxID=2878680 RepID=UPI001CF02273|nr:hypothetical protein [Natrinema sp. DC36]
MSTETESSTATGIVQSDTSRETYIGWANWNRREANQYWPADYVYERKGRYYEHLDEIDAGKKNGFWYNEKYLRHITSRDIINNLGSNLGLTNEQCDKAESFFLSQNLSKWGVQKEYVAWAICAYLLHSSEMNGRKCHPQTSDDNYDEQVLEAAISLGMTQRECTSLYGKVEHKFRQRERGT